MPTVTARRPAAPRPPRAARRPAGRPAKKPLPPAAAIRYLESSAMLAALLEQDAAALRSLRAEGQLVTSALTFAEASRVLVRARVSGRLTSSDARAAGRALGTLERRCTVVAISEAVLARAGRPFPIEPVRTLDAIHLATAELLGATPHDLVVVTRDGRVRDNATALGYRVE
jgi:predicted nucleic acid-binding protein